MELGRASSSHQHSSGTSVHRLLQSLIPWNSNIPSSTFCASRTRAAAQAGHPQVQHSAHKLSPSCALDVQATNQELEISQNMTLQHGKPQRKHNNLPSEKESWRCNSPDLTAKHPSPSAGTGEPDLLKDHLCPLTHWETQGVDQISRKGAQRWHICATTQRTLCTRQEH